MKLDRTGLGLRRDFLKFFLFDVMVALVFGLVSWIVEKDPITSFLISLVTAAVLLVVELRFQIGGTTQELALALGVEAECLDDEQLMTTLVGGAKDYNRVQAFQNHLFNVRADEIVRNFTHDLAALREGQIALTPDQTFPYNVKMLHDTKTTVFFTLLLRVARFWYRSNNQDYVDVNLATAARGVKMTRVVIISKAEDLAPELVDIIRTMAKGGIDMRIAFESELAPELNVDMGLYDQAFVAYSDINPGDRGLKGTRIQWRPSDVRKAIILRDRILHDSEDALQFLARSHLLPAEAALVPTTELVAVRSTGHPSKRSA